MNEEVDQSGEPKERRPAMKTPLFRAFTAGVVILVVLGVFQVLSRRRQFEALAKQTVAENVQTVAIIHPTLEGAGEELVLPGYMQAYVESPIYARTTGYLKKWYHDIGSRVSRGDRLADIETPEVDQQLVSARADLATAQANEQLARITDARYRELLKSDSVSKQEADNAAGDLAAKKAIVQSSQANVRRLEELFSFRYVDSPFSGVVTRRNVDTGTLINAGNGGASQLLFSVAQTDPLRVYLSVPEADAPSIRAGLDASLEVTQLPGETVHGKVVRTAEMIDPTTHALLTEVDVPNPSGKLLPGGYAQTHIRVRTEGQRLRVPVHALLFRSEGLRAVKIDEEHRARLIAVTIGRDYGTSLEVVAGLKPEDFIVLNPTDGIEEGQKVEVREVANPLAPRPENKPAAPGTGPAKRQSAQ